MKKQLLIAIAKRLNVEMNKAAIVSKFGRLNYIARFRNQFMNPDETIPKLAVAVEFLPSGFSNRSKKQQEITFQVRIHVHNRIIEPQKLHLGKDMVTGLKDLEYLEEIHKVLHGWKPECFTTFERVEEAEDVTYDFAIDDTVTYETTAIDASADPRNNYEEVDVELEVNGENIPPPQDQESPYRFET